MTYAGWHIERLKFTGKDDKEALLNFAAGLSLVYGASNTGKSFALKALDFMLGGQRELPNIKERTPYDKLWLDIAFSPDHRALLERALVGEEEEEPLDLHAVTSGEKLLQPVWAEAREAFGELVHDVEAFRIRQLVQQLEQGALRCGNRQRPVPLAPGHAVDAFLL